MRVLLLVQFCEWIEDRSYSGSDMNQFEGHASGDHKCQQCEVKVGGLDVLE